VVPAAARSCAALLAADLKRSGWAAQ
jgi:hypothetical protein